MAQQSAPSSLDVIAGALGARTSPTWFGDRTPNIRIRGTAAI